MSEHHHNDDSVGYRRPPQSTRFTKGMSGNPAGRPRGRYRHAPYEAVLGQMVPIVENGIERRITAEKAFLLQLAKHGLEGDAVAAREALTAIERAESEQSAQKISTIVLVGVGVGSVTFALEPLRMAKRLDPYRETARILLEPWLVEAALARRRDPLTPAEQRVVLKATRTPHRVRWPKWWTETS